ncbi:hypothetical protein AB1N83_011218 [Pleurotus pulmonarius]
MRPSLKLELDALDPWSSNSSSFIRITQIYGLRVDRASPKSCHSMRPRNAQRRAANVRKRIFRHRKQKRAIAVNELAEKSVASSNDREYLGSWACTSRGSLMDIWILTGMP